MPSVAIDSTLWRDPRVSGLAALREYTSEEAFYSLVRLWSWFAEHQVDGSLSGLDDDVVAGEIDLSPDAFFDFYMAGWIGGDDRLVGWRRYEQPVGGCVAEVGGLVTEPRVEK